MKNSIIISAFALASIGLLFIGLSTKKTNDAQVSDSSDLNKQELVGDISSTITPIEHSTAVISLADTTVYVDPIGGGVAFIDFPQADIVLITDIHGDHLNIKTLEHVVTQNTVVVAPQAVADLLPEILKAKTVILANGAKTEQKGITIEAVAMYNLPESTSQAHTKGRGNGYVLEKNNERVYVAGDTSATPEMRALTNIDIALIPMNLPFTMSVEDAADAVLAFTPAKVYPYHYRTKEGFSDVEKFKSLVKEGNPNIQVELLDWYPISF